MTMPSWTIDGMLAEEPCEEYTRERIEELYAGKPSLTLLEILDHPDVPHCHKVWVACLDKNTTRCAAIEAIVTRSVTNYALHCGIPTVEQWAKMWLSGEDRSLAAARDAADTAAWAAVDAAECAADAAVFASYAVAWKTAWAAADAATWAAAWAVALKTTWDVADAAALKTTWDVADAAALKTAGDAERALQVQDFRDALVQGHCRKEVTA